MPYLTLKEATVRDVNGDAHNHLADTVLSDWEVEPFVKDKLEEGSLHYRSLLEPITKDEAHSRRSKATVMEGDHYVDGQHVSPPWDDYVGLSPEEIIQRMHDSTQPSEVHQTRQYERGGLNRLQILEYVAPVERAPIHGYDDLGVREVLDKLELLSDVAVREVLTYEAAHRKRPAIITFLDNSSTEPEPKPSRAKKVEEVAV